MRLRPTRKRWDSQTVEKYSEGDARPTNALIVRRVKIKTGKLLKKKPCVTQTKIFAIVSQDTSPYVLLSVFRYFRIVSRIRRKNRRREFSLLANIRAEARSKINSLRSVTMMGQWGSQDVGSFQIGQWQCCIVPRFSSYPSCVFISTLRSSVQ